MTLDELRNLDFENVGSWPLPVKVAALVIALGLVVGGGYWYFWQERMERLEEVASEEESLRQELKTKQQRAANLEEYKKQLEEMRATFGDMLRQLPSRAEVSELLVDISNEGLSSGLKFDLFNPQSPKTRDFYAELPVKIRVNGKYDEFGRFVSGVANLPRIVTLDSVAIARDSGSGDDDEADLNMDLTAKTYWYREQGDDE